jgi:hypothetical protein
MRNMMRFSIAAIWIACLVVAPGCEDSPLTPGADSTMTLIAQPSAVPIDQTGPVTITATVLTADGVPQGAIAVYFSNNGGTITPSSGSVETNSSGIATATLTVEQGDSTDIDVTATSASLTKTVKITRGANQPPVPVIVAVPAEQQAQGKAVIFDGTDSSDPDTADHITYYKWSIFSEQTPDPNRDNPLVIEGAGASSISIPNQGNPAFQNVQHLTVTLQVTDSHGLSTSTSIPYDIVQTTCVNPTRPIASILPSSTVQLSGHLGDDPIPANFDGYLSRDPDGGAIANYRWNCGPTVLPNPQGQVSTVCAFPIVSPAQTYTVTLVVTDGPAACPQDSLPATVQVVVTPITP